MDNLMWHCFVWNFVFVLFTNPVCGANDPDIAVSIAPGSIVKPNTDVSISCQLDSSRLGSSNAIWQMKRGSVVTRIGAIDILSGTLNVEGNRYMLSSDRSTEDVTYILTIRNVKYEDSGTIECVFERSQNNRKSSVVLVVCDDKDSASCECSANQEGWNSPVCFKEPADWVAKNKGYKDAVVALGVLLGIVILIGLLLALLAGKDCMANAVVQKKKDAERRALSARTNGVMIPTSSRYDDSEQLTLDLNESASDIGVGGESGMLRREFTTLNDVEPLPRQRGRRAERMSGQNRFSDVQIVDDRDDRSDSGMSSTNTSSASAVAHQRHSPQEQQQDSTHGGARPKQNWTQKGSPPPSYKNVDARSLPKRPQETHSQPSTPRTPEPHREYQYPSQQEQQGNRNMYRTQDNLAVQSPTTPNGQPQPSPRGVYTEPPQERPKPAPRAPHTDVSKAQEVVPPRRGYYTGPRKLEYSGENNNTRTGSEGGEEGGAYVDQSSTVI